MADIRPFRGILYNPRKIKDPEKVVAGPYDIIGPAEQKAYYQSHPCNIVRLILGEGYCSDDSKNNRYTRAGEYLRDWLKRGILRRDKKESIYIYSQAFTHNNKRKVRTGFIVLLKLEDFAKNTILPHENTFCQAVEDRLKLLSACRANLSPIFSIFADPQEKVNKLLSRWKKGRRPCLVIRKDRVAHSLWRLSRKREIAAARKLLKQSRIFIADGHHRYEAALRYKLKRQRSRSGPRKRAPFDYVMAYLTPAGGPGLTILPTHRAVRIKGGFNLREVRGNLEKAFCLRRFSGGEELFSYLLKSRGASVVFGAYFGKKGFWGLRLKDSRRRAQKAPDAAVLHSAVIEGALNPGGAEQNICYTRDAGEAVKLVDKGGYQAAFFLRPATVKEVQRAAFAGKKMPHKSTYFYPKLFSGLTINKL